MSSTVTIKPYHQGGPPVQKDTVEEKNVLCDWDSDLATLAIISTSTFAITRVRPELLAGDTTPLTKDNAVVVTGDRKTQVRVKEGTLGGLYKVSNVIVTNESPTQTKEGSFLVEIIDK